MRVKLPPVDRWQTARDVCYIVVRSLLAFWGLSICGMAVGGLVFKRRDEIWDYFRRRALEKQKYPELGCAIGPGAITDKPDLTTCKYDPMLPRGLDTEKNHLSDEFNEFRGPDEHRYAWVEVKDRNQWVFVDKDRNTASYKIIRDYNEKVTKPNEEGDAAYDYLLPVKYYMDAYYQFN